MNNYIKRIMALIITTCFISMAGCSMSMGADDANALDAPRGINSGEIGGDVTYLARISGTVDDGVDVIEDATVVASVGDYGAAEFSTLSNEDGEYDIFLRVLSGGNEVEVTATKDDSTYEYSESIYIEPGEYVEGILVEPVVP